MKIKLIIFDLDGVLFDGHHLHYHALNRALGEKYKISWDEHLSFYEGLTTTQKLKLLEKDKGLHKKLHNQIYKNKQQYTLQELKEIKPNKTLQSVLNTLTDDGYVIAVCTNAGRKTALIVLSKLGLTEYLDLILTREDVIHSKPHPEIYWKTISTLGYLSEETLIVEDSPPGLLAAKRSNSHVLKVKNTNEVTYVNINKKINEI